MASRTFEVGGEGGAAGFAEGVAGLGTAEHFLGFGGVAGFEEGAEVGDEVAVAHFQFGFEILEGPVGTRGQQGHDGETPFFVDDFVELGKVDHAPFGIDSGLVPLHE